MSQGSEESDEATVGFDRHDVTRDAIGDSAASDFYTMGPELLLGLSAVA